MKKKIIMVGPALTMKGGVASVSNTLLQSDVTGKYEINYVSSYIDGNKFSKLVVAFFGLVRMFLLLIAKNIKIVHIHSASRGSFRRKLFYYFLAKLFRKKVIYHIHGAEFMLYYNEVYTWEKWLISHVLTNVDNVIALSNRWKKDLQNIAPNASIEVVHNPVNSEMFNKKRIHCNVVNVVFMGRLGERKGIYDLLDVIPKILKEHDNVLFQLCGDGDIKRVQKVIDETGLNENVFVPGWIGVEEKISYLQKGSIFILPSYNEGLPISILEAMASSMSIIATTVGGIPEAVDEGKNGYLIEPGDKLRLEESLVKLIESEKLRKEMGKYSYEKCKQYFDVHVVSQKISNIYASILK